MRADTMEYRIRFDVRRADTIGNWEPTEKIIEADNLVLAKQTYRYTLACLGYDVREPLPDLPKIGRERII